MELDVKTLSAVLLVALLAFAGCVGEKQGKEKDGDENKKEDEPFAATLLWQTSLQAEAEESWMDEWLHLSGDRLVVTTEHRVVHHVFHNVYALDTGSGERLWKARTAEMHEDPVFTEELLIVREFLLDAVDIENSRYRTTALSLENGETTWQAEDLRPRAATGALLLATDADELVSVDLSNGTELWRRHAGGVGSLSAHEGRYFWTAPFDETQPPEQGRTIVSVDPHTGAPVWSRTHSMDHRLTFGEGLVVVTDDEGMHALDPENGTERWTLPTATRAHYPPAISPGLVVHPETDRLVAVETDDGSTRWTASIEGNLSGSPTIHGGVVYTMASGILHAYDTQDGSLLAKTQDPRPREVDRVDSVIGDGKSYQSLENLTIEAYTLRIGEGGNTT